MALQLTQKQRESLARLGYDHDEHRYLQICGSCFHLREPNRPGGRQACWCLPRTRQRKWPRYDYNERAALCLCCGLELLHSGSRWSVWFCRECQLLAMGVSVWQRQLIFPIGRHTIMNSFVPEWKPTSFKAHGDDSQALLDTVREQLKFVSRGSDGLYEWYPQVMRANFDELGFSGDVPVCEYLLRVAEADIAVLGPRLRRFEGLCELFKDSSDGPNDP